MPSKEISQMHLATRLMARNYLAQFSAPAVFIVLLTVSSMGNILLPVSSAEPTSGTDSIRPLPAIIPTASNWAPKFPFPFDKTRKFVTENDIRAEREMCQWYNAQYDELIRQIDRVQFNRIADNGQDFDYTINGVQDQVDILAANIDQSVEYLAPRASALTQSYDSVGDSYFPLYHGESFYLLWQHLSNVNDGIKSHQPDWFTGPSVLRVKRWGSAIHRAHVCD